jgi:outer membrane protein assembly factor BamB
VTHSTFVRTFFNTCLLTLSLVDFVHAENWPQWRGPNGDGISTETNLPTHWSATEGLAWSLPLPGMGGSTPIVWNQRIFLTSADDKDGLWLLCISTEGKELWRRKLANYRFRHRMAQEGNDASPSPSTDGKHVWAFVGSGDFACFDFDGNQVWQFNAQERYGKFQIQYGMHTTPLLYGDRLYLQLLHSGGAHVIALDKNTGATVWQVERKSDAVAECEQSYASPVVWRNGDQAYLITHGCDYAIAHRLDNGAEIWRLGDLNPKDRYNRTLRFVASPVAAADLIVVPSAKNGPVVGVKPVAEGIIRAGRDGEQWRIPNNTPDVPSPLVHDGLVYLCRENGLLICLDAKTGKQLYAESLHKQRYRASPVYADGKIYLTARDGVVSVVKAGPKFELLAVNRMNDDISASPAIANGRIYLRGFKALYALEKSKPTPRGGN